MQQVDPISTQNPSYQALQPMSDQVSKPIAEVVQQSVLQTIPESTSRRMPQLTSQQQQVINHQQGHARVMAVAGSGKTTTLVHRVMQLLAQGFHPRRVLVLMYNRSAKDDFTNKLIRRVQEQPNFVSLPDIRTFHSIGHRLCESFYQWGVLGKRKLVKEGWPYERLVRQAIVQALGHVDEQARRKALDKDHLEAFLQFVERVKADLIPPAEQFKQLKLPSDQKYFIEAFDQLEQLMANEGVMTFSDLIYRPAMAMLSQPELEQRVSNHLDHVIVDEYQDINSIQQYLLNILAGDRAQVMVVGDVDQCIYEWRGARPEFMLGQFEQSYPGCTTYSLSYSFRYGHTLALAANHVISENRLREPQLCLATPQHPDTGIATFSQLSELLEPLQQALSQSGSDQCAVLVRSWALSMPLQLIFLQQQIPFRLMQQGHFVFNQPLVTQYLAYLELVALPVNQAIPAETLNACLSFPPLFLSQQEQQNIIRLVEAEGLDPEQVTKRIALKPYALKRLKKRLQLLLQLQRQSDEQPVGPVALKILLETDAYELIEKAAATRDQAEERKRTLQALVNYIRQQRVSVGQCLEQIQVQKLSGASLTSDQGIMITTVHGAKGLEWDTVILAGLTEGSFPCYQNLADFQDKEEESERRLFYVALTRAKKQLFLISDNGLNEEGKKKSSRFLAEMALEDCLKTLQCIKQPESANAISVSKPNIVLPYLSAQGIQLDVQQDEGADRPTAKETMADHLKIGDHIEHKIFGRGMITRIERGQGTRIDVDFGKEGQRLLLAERAPIRLLRD